MSIRRVGSLSSFTFILHGLIYSRYDGDTEIDEDDDVITSSTRRQRRKTGSDTTSAATETTKAQTGYLQNALKNSRKPSKIISLPGIVSTSASVLDGSATSKEESSDIKQQSRSSVQTMLLDKPSTSSPSGVKRKRLEPEMTAEAVKEATQSISAVEPSSIQLRQSSKHRRLKPNTSIEAATTKAAQTVSVVEPLSTQLHQSPKYRRFKSSTPSKSATEATKAASAAEPSTSRSHQSPNHSCLKSDTSAEVAAEAKHTPIIAGSSSAQSDPSSEPSNISNHIKESSSRHEIPNPSIPETSMDTKKQNKTTLWISIPSSTDAVPLTLRSCMTLSSLFHSVYKIYGLAEQHQQDKVLGLRTTLEWTHNVGDVKKYLMLKRDFEDSFDIFLKIIDALPCWEQADGCCSVAIEVVMMA